MRPDVRLKHLACLNTGIEDPSPRPRLDLESLESGTGKLAAGVELRASSDPGTGVAQVAKGDVLFGKLRPYLAKSWVADRPCFASTELLCLRPKSGVDSRWLGYVVANRQFVEFAIATSDGAKMPRTSWSKLAEFRLEVPDLESQEAIADYLDRETAQIDALTAAKRMMISLAEERLKVAVSTSTEARCAVEACRLPSGWRLVPLRRCLSSTTYGIGDSTHDEGNFAVLGMANINSGAIVGKPGGFVDKVEGSLLLRPGDLLFNRTNSRELVGKVGFVESLNGPTTFASYLVRLRTSELVEPEYLSLLLNTSEVLGLARSMALPSIGQANLNPKRYSAIALPIPPIEVQRQIAQEINVLSSKFGTLKRILGRQIYLLDERRKALVTAGVTGQLDFPGDP